MSVPTGADEPGADNSGADDLVTLDRAIAALEQQRTVLGPEVVDVALESLQQRRRQLLLREGREQRKLVTVLFADLVDFTVLSQRLDPEDTRVVMGRYFTSWQDIIHRHGGTVEKFIGDAVMAVFGLYRSEEDDAQRAVRAALAMIDELADLNTELAQRYAITLTMRIGVDSGDVVISTLDERAGHEFVVVGPTVNRAARLQAVAPVDRVLVSADTHRQIRGRFNLEPRPGLVLKGLAEPVDAYVATSERPLAFRQDHAGVVAGVATTTVGRDLDLRFLQDQLRDAVAEHELRLVTIVGDAGVGKSRLLFDLDNWIVEQPELYRWLRGRASPLGRNRPYALLHDMLRNRFGILDSDAPDGVRTKFEQAFADPAAAHLVARWLGFELGLPPVADPQTLQTEAEIAFADFLGELAEPNPIVMLLEDLHWADDATLTWLATLHRRVARIPMLVVGTARPALLELRPHWAEGQSHHHRRELTPLSTRAVRELLDQILERVVDPPAELVDLVIEGAEGNPYYLEELVTWLIDAGVLTFGADGTGRVASTPISAIAVPSTLRGVLQARLDALSLPERVTLQRASVVGRLFWDEAVTHLAGSDAPPAGRTFDALRRRQLVFQRELSVFDDAREYLFKHALLRDVAYDGVLRTHRERYHRAAAAWLADVTRRTGRELEYAALIAEHYDKGRDPQAAGWYLRAGLAAAAVFALDDANRLLDRAELVLPPGDLSLRFDVLAAREDVCEWLGRRADQQHLLAELEQIADLDAARRVRLMLARARLRFSLSEYAAAIDAAETALALAESEQLVEQSGEALLWWGKALVWDDELAAATEKLERSRAVGERVDRAFLIGESQRYLAMAANNAGRYAESLELSLAARDVFTAAGHAEAATMAQAMYATTCFNMGRIADARRGMEELIPLFVRSGNRYRQAVALGNLASIAATQGELAQAEVWAREAAGLTAELSDREATAVNLTVVGEVEVLLGRTEAAVATLTRVREMASDKGAAGIAATALALIAVARLDAGQPERALTPAEEAVAVAPADSAPIDRGRALLALGYALHENGRPAAETFEAAYTVFDEIGHASFAREAQVGRAVAATGGGERESARTLARQVVDAGWIETLQACLRPTAMARDLCRLLDELGEPDAAEVRTQAVAALRRQADQAGDETVAAEYLARPAAVALVSGI